MKGETNGVKWRSLRTDAQIIKEYHDKLNEEFGNTDGRQGYRNTRSKTLAQKRLIIYSKAGKHRGNNKEIR